jgi:hypothetical protein
VAATRSFSDAELLRRFPDQATYNHFRTNALGPVRRALRASQARLDELLKERRDFDATFDPYPNRPIPAKLQQSIDARNAEITALEALVHDQQCNLERQTEIYDRAAVRLEPRWAAKAS